MRRTSASCCNASPNYAMPRRRCRAPTSNAAPRSKVALKRIMVLAEAYPDLKASANFLELQQELSRLEDEIQMARRYYNGSVRNLNTLVESFPSNIVAGTFRFEQRKFFELADASEGAVPHVTLASPRVPQ
jgi:LemA protein